MKTGINKQLILEAGHIILEAVHRGDANLDKSRLKDPNLSYAEGKRIVDKRNALSANIKKDTTERDWARSNGRHSRANSLDNYARETSQTGSASVYGKEHKTLGHEKYLKMNKSNPRMISSARQ